MELTRKSEVQSDGVAPEIWYAIGVANALRTFAGLPHVVVCAMKDGKHMRQSLHASGHAVDLRTHDLSPDTTLDWSQRVNAWLNEQGFDVVLEHNPPHLHIEHDPKPGEHFWTEETAV